MKKCKYSMHFLIILVMIIGVLVGCSQKSSENIIMTDNETSGIMKETVVTFFGYKADSINLVAIENALHGFMDENPDIMVTYEGLKGTSYWEAFDKRNESGNMDDVMMMDHDHVLSLNADHKLVDLSDLSTIKDFDSMAQNQFIGKDGSIYFLPTCISTYGLYVNLDLLKEHGQKIPTNLNEFIQVCDYFVSQGITPIILNNYSSLKCLIVARGLYSIYQQDDPQAEIEKFNTGEADFAETLRSGFVMVDMMIDRGYFDCEEALETMATSDDLTIFAEGERPFMVTGGWASPRVIAMDPGFSFEVHPFPVLDDGNVLIVNVDTCVSINADSSHIQEAKQLIEYVTQKDVMWEYCDSQSSFTPLKDDRVPSDPTIQPLAECLKKGQIVIGADYNLELPLDTALTECGNQMLQGMEVDEAIKLLLELLQTEG